MQTKECTRCKNERGFDAFYKCRRNKDGKSYMCKSCFKEDYYNNIERNRKTSKDRYYRKRGKKLTKDRNNKDSAAYRSRNPEKKKAHAVLRHSLGSGQIKKSSCEICGSDKGICGHHEDYNRPLDVNWFCDSCHRLWHDITKEWSSIVIVHGVADGLIGK